MDWMDFDLIAGWLNPAVRQHITDELKIEVGHSDCLGESCIDERFHLRP